MAWEAESMRAMRAPKEAFPTPSSSTSSPVPVQPLHADEPDGGSAISGDAGLVLNLGAIDGGVLPSGAPKSVKLGLVFVTYAGAEGAPSTARKKADARALADRLATDAQTDFHRAVLAGDTGSSDDLGRIPRGVLDPATEVAVFSLTPGSISSVIETPRGYWIAKRLD